MLFRSNDRMYPEGDPLTAAQGIGFIDKAMAHTKAWHGAELSWFLFYMHDVTDARALVLRSMLDHIADHDDRVWCTTYAEATIYEQQREQATLKVLGRTGSSVSFTLTHDLDAKIYHRPLTVVIPAAGKVARAWAIRDGSAPPPQVKIRDQRILVDVVPAPAGVVVGWE